MDYSSSDYSGAQAGAFAGFGIFMFFIIALIVLMVISTWRIFEKAGKPGWASIVPIYRTMIMIEIVGKPSIWILWCLLPCSSIVFGVWILNLLNKSFGKDEAFTIGMLFLPFIFWPMLGFGSAKYLGPSAQEAQPGYGDPYYNNHDNPYSPFYKGNDQPPTTP